jgi:toxin-antitoxin system PIN domain toxin
MKGFLLDVNVLLALCWPNHPHHESAQGWFEQYSRRDWATCAITQLGFIRLSAHPRFSVDAKSPQTARELLMRLIGGAHHRYWQEPPSGVCTPKFDEIWESVLTHELVTDAYLVCVAKHNGGRVATFDRSLQRIYKDHVESISIIH